MPILIILYKDCNLHALLKLSKDTATEINQNKIRSTHTQEKKDPNEINNSDRLTHSSFILNEKKKKKTFALENGTKKVEMNFWREKLIFVV